MDELGEPKKLELIEVNFYHDDDDIFGMMTVYDNGEEEIELPHKPKKTPSNLKTLQILLDEGEYIKEIKGFAGQWIRQIQLVTSTGKKHSCGKALGEEFHIKIPKGKHPVAFVGGVSEHLDNLGCYFK